MIVNMLALPYKTKDTKAKPIANQPRKLIGPNAVHVAGFRVLNNIR